MTSKRAESTDQASFRAVDPAGLPGKLCGPTMASPELRRMLAFAPFQGFIRGMSVNPGFSWRPRAHQFGDDSTVSSL